MKHLLKKNYQGFSILAVILVIVAIVIALSVWSFSGTVNNTNSPSDKVLANNIIKDGAAIKSTYDRLIISGANYQQIVFKPGVNSTSTAMNVYDPLNGMEVPKVNPNAIRSNASTQNNSEGLWIYSSNFIASYIGDRLLPDPSVLVAGVKDSVCKQINMQLYGSSFIPSISGYAYSHIFVTGATQINPNTNSMIGIFTPEDMYWMSGCISANNNPDNNVYFMVLKPI